MVLGDEILPSSLNMPSGLGWDIAVEPHLRFRHGAFRAPFPGAPFVMGGHGGRDPLGAGRFSTILRRRELALNTEARFLNEGFDMEMLELMFLERLGTNVVPDFRSYIRHSHPRPPATTNDDSRNPLLLSNNRPGRDNSPHSREQQWARYALPFSSSHFDGPLAVINHLMQRMPINFSPGHTVNIQFTGQGPQGEIRHVSVPFPMALGGFAVALVFV